MNHLQFLLIVFVSLVELSWLSPWLVFLVELISGQNVVLAPAVVFVLFFFAQGVAGLLNRWRIAERYQRIGVGSLMLLTAFLMIRAQLYVGLPFWNLSWLVKSLENLVQLDPFLSRELSLFLANLVIWWRGLRMSRGLFHTDNVGFRFRLGILLLIGLLVIRAFGDRLPMMGWVLSLFLCGLVSLALARVREGVPRRQDARHFNLRWLFLLIVGAGGTLLLGLLVSTIFSTDTLIWRWLGPVFKAVGTVLFFIIFVVSYVLVWVICRILEALPMPQAQPLPTVAVSPLVLPEGLLSQSTETPVWLEGVQQGVTALVVVGLFVLVLLVVRRWRRSAARNPDLWRESVWSSKEVGLGLLQGVQSGLRRLAGLWSDREARRAYSEATVRKIYASLLALADKGGVTRPLADTPVEYLPTLQGVFPGWEAELRDLTMAYVDAHYGLVPDTEAELQTLRAAWHRIKTWAESQPENARID
jgi:hypothetical protein